MLKILSINPTGFGPYGFHDDVPINERGVVWLTGDNRDKGGSNASGKSSLFNVIAHCLWGRIETVVGESFTTTDDVSNEVMERGSCPRVVFEDAGGVMWRVTCSRKWKALKSNPSPYLQDSSLWPFKGSDVYFERWDGTQWVDERMSTSAKTRDKIRTTIGVSYERYLVTTYLAQGKGLDFLRGSHAQRMAIFTNIFDLGLWDSAVNAFKVCASEATKIEQKEQLALARLQGELAGITLLSDEQVETYRAELAATRSTISSYELKKAEHEAALVQIAEQIGSIRIGANPYTVQLREFDLQQKVATDEALKTLAEREGALTKELQRYKDAMAAIGMRTSSDVQQVQAKLAVAQVSLSKAQKMVVDFQEGRLTHCPTCGQELPTKIDGAHLQAECDNCVTEVKALEELLQEEKVRHDLVIKQAQAAEAMHHESTSNGLTSLLNNARAAVEKVHNDAALKRAALLQQQAAYDASESSKNEALASMQQERARVQEQLAGINQWLQQALASVASYELALKNNEASKNAAMALEQKVEEAEQKVAQAKLDAAEWSWLVKNCGDKGVKAYKLDVICHRLNELLAEALADIDGSFRMWVKPYRVRPGAEDKPEELLTSEDVVNEITIYVQEGVKKAVPVYMYSGGEASIMALALLVALWQHADEQGSGTNLLLLDEVVGFLDARNSQIVVRFLEGLKIANKTVLTVSHSQVVDSVHFDAVWTAIKENGVSRLERE